MVEIVIVSVSAIVALALIVIEQKLGVLSERRRDKGRLRR